MNTTKHTSFAIKPLVLSTCALSMLVLVGCQSMPAAQSASTTSISAVQTPAAAKAMIIKAAQQQRRTSFAYHSNIEINNRQKFVGVKADSIVADSDYVGSYCEDKHDQDYAALIGQAQKQDKDVAAAAYSQQREAIKNEYLACSKNYRAWDDNQYSYDNEYDESYASDEREKKSVSPYYQKLFDEYDERTTALDIKKAQLLDAYLFKPLSIDAQGVYQPLAGRFTILPSAQYHARNHHTSISQPIYVDAKSGSIYLWADNIAMINAAWIDDELGTKWKNKWLKITMNDGSLPKGFGKALIKSHFKAMDATLAQADAQEFEFITAKSLNMMSPKLPAHQLQPMLQSSQIVRRVQDNDSRTQALTQYYNALYASISAQYPEFIEEIEHSDGNDGDDAKQKWTSKVMVQQGLAMIKRMIDVEAHNDDETSVNAITQDLSGFDRQGNLLWQHNRMPLSTVTDKEPAMAKQVMIDTLQQYTPIRAQDSMFPNLPSDMQVPTAQNSVDAREYGELLMQRYRNGEGAAIGQQLFNMLPMLQSRLDMAAP